MNKRDASPHIQAHPDEEVGKSQPVFHRFFCRLEKQNRDSA